MHLEFPSLCERPSLYYEHQIAEIVVIRDEITNIMRENNPSGFDNRFPGKNKKKQVPRAQLESIGPFREISTDGHEKLAEQGLRMGGVTLPIYGAKDKWSAALLYLKVLPQVRKPGPIGHVFLDIFEDIGGEYLGKASVLSVSNNNGMQRGSYSSYDGQRLGERMGPCTADNVTVSQSISVLLLLYSL